MNRKEIMEKLFEDSVLKYKNNYLTEKNITVDSLQTQQIIPESGELVRIVYNRGRLMQEILAKNIDKNCKEIPDYFLRDIDSLRSPLVGVEFNEGDILRHKDNMENVLGEISIGVKEKHLKRFQNRLYDVFKDKSELQKENIYGYNSADKYSEKIEKILDGSYPDAKGDGLKINKDLFEKVKENSDKIFTEDTFEVIMSNYLSNDDIKSLLMYNDAVGKVSSYLNELNYKTIVNIAHVLELDPLLLLESIKPVLVYKLGFFVYSSMYVYFSDRNSDNFKIFFNDCLKKVNINSSSHLNILTTSEFSKEKTFKLVKPVALPLLLTVAGIGGYFLLSKETPLPPETVTTIAQIIKDIPEGQGIFLAEAESVVDGLKMVSYTAGRMVMSPIASFLHGAFDANRELLIAIAELLEELAKQQRPKK